MLFDPILDFADRELRRAVQQFWNVRDMQAEKQRMSGGSDTGSRGAATGGGHMHALEDLVRNALQRLAIPDLTIFTAASAQNQNIRTKRQLELPGYYRPEKQWDMIVLLNGQLAAAIEFKAQVGPSFGNNSNNRTEEALGTAHDLWIAYREARFGNTPEPFVGYFFLLDDCPEVHLPVKVREPFFKVDPVFSADPDPASGTASNLGVSYSKRYEILCRRLRHERLYSAACLILTTRSARTRISQPAEDLSFRGFMAALLAHVSAFSSAARRP